jgi:hypothetical protein
VEITKYFNTLADGSKIAFTRDLKFAFVGGAKHLLVRERFVPTRVFGVSLGTIVDATRGPGRERFSGTR